MCAHASCLPSRWWPGLELPLCALWRGLLLQQVSFGPKRPENTRVRAIVLRLSRGRSSQSLGEFLLALPPTLTLTKPSRQPRRSHQRQAWSSTHHKTCQERDWCPRPQKDEEESSSSTVDQGTQASSSSSTGWTYIPNDRSTLPLAFGGGVLGKGTAATGAGDGYTSDSEGMSRTGESDPKVRHIRLHLVRVPFRLRGDSRCAFVGTPSLTHLVGMPSLTHLVLTTLVPLACSVDEDLHSIGHRHGRRGRCLPVREARHPGGQQQWEESRFHGPRHPAPGDREGELPFSFQA